MVGIRLPFTHAREGRPSWFIGPLRVETLREDKAGRLRYKLLEPLIVSSAVDGLSLTVPMDFLTDFASVPRFFWRWFPPAGDYAPAAVVHDWLYGTRQGMSRFLADAFFRDLMASLSVPLWKRVMMYYAVRLFSRRYWR